MLKTVLHYIKRGLRPLCSTLTPDLWGNAIIATSLALIFSVLDLSFRAFTNGLGILPDARSFLELVLFFFLLSFAKQRIVLNGIVGFFLLFAILEQLHFTYYGFWIFPIEILLFFQKLWEVLSSLSAILPIFFLPAILAVVAAILTLVVLHSNLPRRMSPLASYLVLMLLLYPALRSAFTDNRLGSRPQVDNSLVKNALNTVGYFLGKTLPDFLLQVSHAPAYSHPPYPLEKNAPQVNIVVIIGESLNTENLSLFGYPRTTTPFLDSLAGDSRFVFKKALSGGVLVDVAVPSLLNLIEKPDGTQHIINGNTNLFRMAKANGFKTHFISTQSAEGLKYFKSYLSIGHIDRYRDPTDFGYDKLSFVNNEMLLEQLNKISFQDNNFIVLQLTGPHAPSKVRTPETERFFQENNLLDAYDNTVRYTDNVLSKIINYLRKQSDKPAFILFTSDHGQSVDKNGYGHGSIHNTKHYQVPFVLYALNTDLTPSLVASIKRSQMVSHFEIGKLIAYFLGYATKAFSAEPQTVYVNGPELNGNSGYLELTKQSDGTLLTRVIE